MGATLTVVSFNLGLIGVNIGKIGPVMAIANSTPVLLLLVNGIFRGFLPSVIKLFGCGVVTLGTFVTILPTILKKDR